MDPDSPTDEIKDGVTAPDTEIKPGANAADSPPANEGAAADSPPAKPDVKTESLVDRIKKATDKTDGEGSSNSENNGDAKTADPEAKPAGEAEGDPGEFTKDDLARLHSKTRTRVQKLLATTENLSKEIESAKPAVEGYANIIGFLKDNAIPFDEAQAAFDILADRRRNPAKALEALLPVVEELQRLTGAVLPDDLVDQVTQGYITENAAQELARLRAQQQLSHTNAERNKEMETRRGAERQEFLTTSIVNSLSSLESQWASSDPDYSKKREEIKDAFDVALYKAKMTGKLPQTTDEAIALAKSVKEKVDSKIRMFQPKKQEIRHVTGSSAPNVRPKAKSLADAIMQAV